MRRTLTVALLAAALLAACAPTAPQATADRRTWRGPTDTVASEGITVYDRREIAQKVSFPTCITVGAAAFQFDNVRAVSSRDPLLAGLLDTGYSLDRWRLLAPAGALGEQRSVFVTVGGSTGIIAEYPRLPAGRSC